MGPKMRRQRGGGPGPVHTCPNISPLSPFNLDNLVLRLECVFKGLWGRGAGSAAMIGELRWRHQRRASMWISRFSSLSTELRRGVGQPEGSGGEDESGAPQPERRRVAAQEEPRLPQQDLPSALQRIPDGRGRADRSRQESAGLAGQVDVNTGSGGCSFLCKKDG